MQVEITESMRADIIKQVSSQLMKELRASINIKKLSEQIHGEVKGKIVSELAGDFHKKLNSSDLVKTSMQAAQDKINARIQKVIQQGVVLKIELSDKE